VLLLLWLASQVFGAAAPQHLQQPSLLLPLQDPLVSLLFHTPLPAAAHPV
jgi:hypothetical protein